MMKYVNGVIVTLVIATATIAFGHYIDYDMKFLAGWWSCMVWMWWTGE